MTTWDLHDVVTYQLNVTPKIDEQVLGLEITVDNPLAV